MIENIVKLIDSIPDEIKDCFGIEIKYDDGIKLREELIDSYGMMKDKDLNFPLYIKNIPVFIGSSYNPQLRVLENFNCVNKVYLYELNQFKHFIREYEKLSNKYNCFIGGCGCCGSPSIDNFHTIYISYINFKENKVEYDLSISYSYREILKGGSNE